MVEYTVQKEGKNGALLGGIHYADNTDITYCGKPCGDWWVLTTNGSGVATCKECVKKKEEKK